MQILVLGMHRSGTSALTRLVNMMGADLGPDFESIPANEENPKGFWERRDVRKLNDDLLSSVGSDWHHIADFDPTQVPDEASQQFQRNARALLSRMGANRPWVMKEPRLCVTLPAWLPLLHYPVCLICVRDPVEIAQSLEARNGIPVPVGIALAQTYYRRLVSATTHLPRTVVNHRNLLSDPNGELHRLHERLERWGCRGLQLPSAADVLSFIESGLHRQHSTEESKRLHLSQVQDSFFAVLADGDWTSLGDMARMPAPELSLLRLFEADAFKAARIKATDKKLSTLAGQLEKQADANQGLKRKICKLKASEDALGATIRAWEQKVQTLGTGKDGLGAQKQSTERQLDALQAEWSDLHELLERHRDIPGEFKKHLVALADGLAALQQSRSWRLGHGLMAAAAKTSGRRNVSNAFDHLYDRVARAWGLMQILDLDDGSTANRRSAYSDTARAARLPGGSASTARLRKDGVVAIANAFSPAAGNARPGLRQTASTGSRQPRTVVVIAWDTGHNPLGRAYLIAEALARHFHVLLVGPGFERYGSDVWPPVRNSAIKTIRLPGGAFPDFCRMLAAIGPRIEADAVIACKLRMPSLQLALLMKAFRNRPLLIDVDDYELSFFKNRGPVNLHQLRKLSETDGFALPFGEQWTRYAENLVPLADALLVSNIALQQKFGGRIIPHARDETVFDPALYDRTTSRARFGYGPNDRVVLFLGTPRQHKGVLAVAQALRACDDPRFKLCIIGNMDDRSLERSLREVGGDQLQLLPNQPFSELPQNLMIADAVCLFQDPAHEISKYQLPAKVVDALAMGVPVISTALEPLRPLIAAGVVTTATNETLGPLLRQTLNDSERLMAEQRQRRSLFLRDYSYAAIGDDLATMIQEVFDRGPRPLPEDALDFLEIQAACAGNDSDRMAEPGFEVNRDGIDVVVFWKQNDSGLYGRRADMFAKYLVRHASVRAVLMVDRPIALEDLMKKQESEGVNHDREIFSETWCKHWGVRDRAGLSHRVFVYSKKQAPLLGGWQWPARKDYLPWLSQCFADHGIETRRAVFLVYPENRDILALARAFQPRVLVADIVDDHRAWPGRTASQVKELTAHYHDVVGRSDLVIANCEPVQRSMRDFGKDVTLISNACEMEPPPPIGDSDAARTFRALAGPKLGYVGNMEAKFDVDLLHFLARNRPEWQIVLIGSRHANPRVLELEPHANVHFMGVIPYAEVRGWITEFDVAIIPHLDTPQTRSMNPLKLYVYASLGIPVVSTRVDNLDDLKDLVKVADSREEFLIDVEQAIEVRRRGPVSVPEGLLERNSWPTRVDHLMSLIDPLYRSRH
ncbi:MAG: glycosyltransferase [Thiohalocapsa sp.]